MWNLSRYSTLCVDTNAHGCQLTAIDKVPCPSKAHVPECCPDNDCELLEVVWQRGTSADPTVLWAVRDSGPSYFKGIETDNCRNYRNWLRDTYGRHVGPNEAKVDRRRYFQQDPRVIDLTTYRPRV